MYRKNDREIGALTNDTQSNTHHVFLITVVTYDFMSTSIIYRLCQMWSLYHRPDKLLFLHLLRGLHELSFVITTSLILLRVKNKSAVTADIKLKR